MSPSADDSAAEGIVNHQQQGSTAAELCNDHRDVRSPPRKETSGGGDGSGGDKDAEKLRRTDSRQASVEMGDYNRAEYVDLEEPPSSPSAQKFRKVSVLPLVFLIFYEVSGGPFGIEDSVGAAGPLLALLGFLIFPFIWSIPEALITAEMGTMFPENGGYVVWVSSALGPYWGFQQGWMKWLSGVIDNALYPVLFLDYLKSAVPLVGHGFPRAAAVGIITVALTYMNYRGLSIVGWAAVLLGLGATQLNQQLWTDGYLADVAKIIGGVWLSWWIQGAAAMSNMGMFVAEMSSDSFQLLGMAERGMLPEVFGKRSRHVMVVSLIAMAVGLVLQPALKYAERKRWMKFSVSSTLPDLDPAGTNDDTSLFAILPRYEL
ncbi:putative polyamine transporter [Drosera capensis]